jgi:hypothetical protein
MAKRTREPKLTRRISGHYRLWCRCAAGAGRLHYIHSHCRTFAVREARDRKLAVEQRSVWAKADTPCS